MHTILYVNINENRQKIRKTAFVEMCIRFDHHDKLNHVETV